MTTRARENESHTMLRGRLSTSGLQERCLLPGDTRTRAAYRFEARTEAKTQPVRCLRLRMIHRPPLSGHSVLRLRKAVLDEPMLMKKDTRFGIFCFGPCRGALRHLMRCFYIAAEAA